MTTDLKRFLACMEYETSDRRPNHELCAWPQTAERWRNEAPEAVAGFHWDWFEGEDSFGLDRREYIPVNFDFIPPFQAEVLADEGDYEIVRDGHGIVTRALKAGSVNGGRMSMDQHLRHPVESPEDWPEIKRRLVPGLPERYPPDWEGKIGGWERRGHVLVLGHNCAANGFYWRAREFMGTENLSLAFFLHPEMVHDMMETFADLIIETARPILEKVRIDYFTLNEDLSMKTGPLLGPELYAEFIQPRLRRMVDFFKDHGCRYFAIDSDGDPTVLIPLMMDAGVDTLWPIERASGVGPMEWRRRFGRELRLWGGVDKREIAKGPEAIRAHLRQFILLIEEGGFIPTLDHAVPPDISWDNWRYYMDAKHHLLAGEFGSL